jgi:hypothetical protein
MAAGSSVIVQSGGAAGQASAGIGNFKADGGGGQIAWRFGATQSKAGPGGSSVFGSGGDGANGVLNGNPGSPGTAYGSGGGGGSTLSTAAVGGAGAQGCIKITEYFDSGSAAILAGGLPTGGTAAQVLLKNTGTNYDAVWTSTLATVNSATAGASPSTSSTTGVMAGLAGSITPVRSGAIYLTVSGTGSNSTAAARFEIVPRYGTGTAPAPGAALTGTAVGATQSGTSSTAGAFSPFSSSAIVSGLTLGTPYWLDLQIRAPSGTASFSNMVVIAFELP